VISIYQIINEANYFVQFNNKLCVIRHQE